MIRRKERYVSSVLAEEYIKSHSRTPLEKMTGEDVIKQLFGHYDNDYYSLFRIINTDYKPSCKWWQRLNRLWVVPLVWVFVFPFQYIVCGRIGITDESKLGSLLLYLVGEE